MGNGCEKVDPEQRLAIIAAADRGVARKDIALRMGLSMNRINYVLHDDAKRKGTLRPRRKPGAALAQSTPAPEVEAPVANALLDTGGRYAELNAYAADQGITHRQALQRWHRARMGLPMLGVA